MKTGFSTAICLAGFSLLLGAPSLVQAQFNYVTNDGTITITQYTGTGGHVNIPGTITGLPVTSIGDQAFSDSGSLTSVTIPNSVTNIGTEAFSACTSLTTITVDTLNPAYSSVDAVLFNKSQSTLIQYPGGKAGSYTMPNSVTGIGNGAFSYSGSLTSVTIPNSVTSIGDLAFKQCYSLTSVTISNSVTSIGDYAFAWCSSLTSITIPNSVTSIGDSTFYSSTSLTNITLGNSVTSIGDYAFSLCTSLTSITVPNSVNSIGDYAFWGCPSLTAITVDALNTSYSSVDGVLFNKSQTALIQYPEAKAGSYRISNSVTSIGDRAFSYCGSLTSVTVGNSVTSIGDQAFSNCGSLTSVTIGNSVTSIRDRAFYSCTSLTSVVIPDSVTTIGDVAFSECGSLTAVSFEGNAPTLGGNTFYGDDNATIYYNPGTEGWGATYGGRPTALWVRPNPVILSGSVAIQNNSFGFTISWATNASVVVEGSTDLANPDWLPLATNALANGTSYFSDPEWTKFSGRFYRVRSP